jgi:hypothetical protein
MRSAKQVGAAPFVSSVVSCWIARTTSTPFMIGSLHIRSLPGRVRMLLRTLRFQMPETD